VDREVTVTSENPETGHACNITGRGRTRRMIAGAVVAVLASGLLLGFDASFADGPLARWWRLGLVPLVFFSALCVFQAQEET